MSTETFERLIKLCLSSETYAGLCRETHDLEFPVMGMTDKTQLDFLIQKLKTDASTELLELGCGPGGCVRYLSKHMNANLTGSDFCATSIDDLSEHFSDDRLSFCSIDINKLDPLGKHYDFIIAIDSLYFCDSIEGFLSSSTFKTSAFSTFYSQKVATPSEQHLLDAENTSVGKALRANKIAFDSYDFSEQEYKIWEKGTKFAKTNYNSFEKEKTTELATMWINEGEEYMRLFDQKMYRRFLYICKA